MEEWEGQTTGEGRDRRRAGLRAQQLQSPCGWNNQGFLRDGHSGWNEGPGGMGRGGEAREAGSGPTTQARWPGSGGLSLNSYLLP